MRIDATKASDVPEFGIEIKDLCKTYKATNKQPAHEALKKINLQIPQGSFLALLVPNGAGESTLINTLAGLVIKASGSAVIWGHDINHSIRRARRSVGIVPQELSIDPFFTPREILDFQASMYGVPKTQRQTDTILRAGGLTDKANAYTRTLSGGMLRRLLIAKAMVHSPPILVLDEPSAVVDVGLRRRLWENVKEINAMDITIMLTTPFKRSGSNL